jgi:dCTP deaminase
MGVLGKSEILLRLFRCNGDPEKQLFITPLLSTDQIGEASVDVRLGNEFIVIKHTNLQTIDPTQGDQIRKEVGQYQDRIRVGFGEEFALHPNQLVLGSTLEYIGLPADLCAQVLGRSSWGRLGLFIATATAVSPGFKGVITLELLNAGQVPLILYPGIRIAQLLIDEVTSKSGYDGKYRYPTGPQFTRIYDDKDMLHWCRTENFR